MTLDFLEIPLGILPGDSTAIRLENLPRIPPDVPSGIHERITIETFSLISAGTALENPESILLGAGIPSKIPSGIPAVILAGTSPEKEYE